MKICRINDESRFNMLIGFLIYYEKSGDFLIELSPELEPVDTPVFFDPFVKDKRYTIDPDWSARWVNQRIVPTDRQNLGAILRENKLNEYDPFRLLMISSGRCAQDDCAVYSDAAGVEYLPKWLTSRFEKRIDFVHLLDNRRLLIMLRDGSILIADLKKMLDSTSKMKSGFFDLKVTDNLRRRAGGAFIEWSGNNYFSAEELIRFSRKTDFDKASLHTFLNSYLIDSSSVGKELGCSRQYISYLNSEGRLMPVLDSSTRVYARSDTNRFSD